MKSTPVADAAPASASAEKGERLLEAASEALADVLLGEELW